MIDCCEVYLPTQHQEKWNFVHKKAVICEEDFSVKLYQTYRDIHLIYGHYIWISPNLIALKCCNILDPYLLHKFNVLDYHWKVLDLVAANNPLVDII